MQVSQIKEKSVWENFLLGCQEKTFLTSWSWGEFNFLMGDKIWRLGVFEGENLISVSLVVKVSAKRGTFLLLPHCPVFKENSQKKEEAIKVILEELKKIAKEEKTAFLRVSPILGRKEENEKIFKRAGFRKAPIHMHPEASWKLNIEAEEKDLLAKMRKTTRYLIKKAQEEKDIEILQSKSIRDVEVFNKLYQEVVKTQKFVPFSLKYLKNEFLAFQENDQISLFFGKYKGEITASSFVIFWSNIGFYHHAALSPKYHKLPIAYLLQWEAIKEAKRRGCVLYDFWGYVDPKSNHPWAGPTLFKMGFGGYPAEYVKTQDFPLSKKYWLTYFFEKLRKTKRGL